MMMSPRIAKAEHMVFICSVRGLKLDLPGAYGSRVLHVPMPVVGEQVFLHIN